MFAKRSQPRFPVKPWWKEKATWLRPSMRWQFAPVLPYPSRDGYRPRHAPPPEGATGMIGHAYDVEMADNVLYPAQFAIPGAVECCSDCFLKRMVHPNHPWWSRQKKPCGMPPTRADGQEARLVQQFADMRRIMVGADPRASAWLLPSGRRHRQQWPLRRTAPRCT